MKNIHLDRLLHATAVALVVAGAEWARLAINPDAGPLTILHLVATCYVAYLWGRADGERSRPHI